MYLLRIIAEDADGLPRVGAGFDRLGVRPTDPLKPERRADVAASEPDDLVSPTEGMSCSLASPADYMAARTRPLERRQFLWELPVDELPPSLRVLADPTEVDAHHVLLTPKVPMPLRAYLAELAGTRGVWRKVELEKHGVLP